MSGFPRNAVVDQGQAAGVQTAAGRFVALTAGDGPRAPLPGRGSTAVRWQVFAKLAEDDLSVARLTEAHCDALAIASELGNELDTGPDRRWAVWAAETSQGGVKARADQDGRWLLSGVKR